MKIQSIFSHIAILAILFFSSAAIAGDERRVPQTHSPIARLFNPQLKEEHHLAKALQERDKNRRAAYAQQQRTQVRRSAPQAPVRTPCVDTLARRTHVHTERCRHGNVSTNCDPCCKPSVKQYRPAPVRTVTQARPCPPQPQIVRVQPQPCPPVQVVVSEPRPAPVNVRYERSYCPPVVQQPVTHYQQAATAPCYQNFQQAASQFSGQRTVRLPDGRIRVYHATGQVPQAPPGMHYLGTGQNTVRHSTTTQRCTPTPVVPTRSRPIPVTSGYGGHHPQRQVEAPTYTAPVVYRR